MIYQKSETQLNNGITHIHYYVPNMKTIGASFTFMAGSGDEYDPGDFGVAHFLEHMIFNGSKEFKDGAEVGKLFAELGVKQNAFTSYDITKYYIVAPNESFAKAFPPFFDRCFYPLLEKPMVEKEIGIIQEERVMGENDPVAKLYHAVKEDLFGKDSYAHDIIGTKSSLQNMTRERLVKLHAKFYAPDNTIFVTYGGLDFEAVKASTYGLIESVKKVVSNPPVKNNVSEFEVISQHSPLLLNKDVDTGFILKMGRLHPILDLERLVSTDLLITLLNDGEGAYINQKFVKENGLCTSVSLDTSAYRNHLTLEFIATTNVDKLEQVEELFSKVRKTLDSVLTEKAIERARNYLLNDILVTLESPYTYTTSSDSRFELLNKWRNSTEFTIENYIELVKTIDKEPIANRVEEFTKVELFKGTLLPLSKNSVAVATSK